MCCFSQAVLRVSNTQIFARLCGGGHQYIAYQMNLSAKEDLAMVLPIPVKTDSGEKAVQFISLKKYTDFFKEMRKGFPVPPPPASIGRERPLSPPPDAKLEVHRVGAFDASFVPAAADFDRLDERFRIPSEVWGRIADYDSFGFAVFKLRAGNSEVHPMAFSFPTAIPGRLFYPTLHIHDGKVHADAEFDHVLYAQGEPVIRMSKLWDKDKKPGVWRESEGIPAEFMRVGLTQGMVFPGEHLYQLKLRGIYYNRDVVAEQEVAL